MGDKAAFEKLLKKHAARKKSARMLKEAGLPVPRELRNKIEKKVRSKLGVMSLATNGMVQSPAVRTVSRFEKNVGGKEKIVEALQVLSAEGALNEQEERFLEVLGTPANRGKTLARIMVEMGVNPLKIMTLYTQGCIALGKMEAAIEAHKGLPQIVKNLNSHALSEAGDVCGLCAGTGKVALIAGAMGPSSQTDCPRCKGAGRQMEASELKKFAMEKLLEVTKLTGQGGGVQVQTNIAVKVDQGGGSVLSKVMGAADEVLYRRAVPAEVPVEAEIVSPSSN